MVFFLFLLAQLAWSAPPVSLDEISKAQGFTVFVDKKSGRILLEHKTQAPLILLLDSPYALKGGVFLALPAGPYEQKGKFFLNPESAERLFPGFAQKTAQPTTTESRCLLERPVRRIFLDPGHGGEDGGTKHGKLQEKEIVLNFARLAAHELRRLGFEVSFSRTKDIFLPLDIRTKIAEKWKADVFISLHVNSSTHSEAQGTETYILSPDATDAEARKLALLENSIAEKAKASESAVQDILWDMEQTTYLQDSAYLASYLQGAIVTSAHDVLASRKGDWKNRGVRQAPFYVLSRAPMPAVLLELGYLSNSRDRQLLSQKFFQESLAKALAEGVKKYKEACRTHH